MDSELIYLDEVINGYLSQFRMPESAYSRIASLAIRGRKELHLHSCGYPTEVTLDVQADNSLIVPDDLLNVISLRITTDNYLYPLTDNNGMVDGEVGFSSGYNNDLGFYKINGNRINLSADFGYDSVILEYLPMATADGEYIVHPLFVEALINWITWQDSRGDRKVSAGDKRENERIFWNSLRLARRAIKPFDLSQVLISYRRTLMQAPRL